MRNNHSKKSKIDRIIILRIYSNNNNNLLLFYCLNVKTKV